MMQSSGVKLFHGSKKQILLFAAILALAALEVAARFSFVGSLIIKNVEAFFHRTLRDPAHWIDVIQHVTALAIFALLNVYFLNYIAFGIKIKSAVAGEFSKIRPSLFSKKTAVCFGGGCALLFAAYFNLLTAHFYYADDVFRNYGGSRSWIDFSRYVSEFLSILVHNNIRLNDIAPLSQFVAIAIAGAALVVLSFSLAGRADAKNVLALSAIFMAPCYAECMAYRFDSPYMAISLLFAALPFLFYRDKAAFCYLSVICLVLTCASYQAALSLYILAAIYLFAKDWLESGDAKKSLERPLAAALCFAAALLLFKLCFMNKMGDGSDSYFSSQVSLAALPGNTLAYVKTAFSFHGGTFSKALFALSILLLVAAFVRRARGNKIVAFVFIAAVLFAACVLSYGPYLVFARPVMAARAFMGFNAFVALVLLACLNLSAERTGARKLAFAVAVLSVYSFAVFAFTYGNFLKNQKEYENFRVQMIIADIAQNVQKGEEVSVSFEGKMDLCQKNRIALRNYPVIQRMYYPMPSSAALWNEELLNGWNFKCKAADNKLTDEYVLVKQTFYHDLYQNNNDFIVVLK